MNATPSAPWRQRQTPSPGLLLPFPIYTAWAEWGKCPFFPLPSPSKGKLSPELKPEPVPSF